MLYYTFILVNREWLWHEQSLINYMVGTRFYLPNTIFQNLIIINSFCFQNYYSGAVIQETSTSARLYPGKWRKTNCSLCNRGCKRFWFFLTLLIFRIRLSTMPLKWTLLCLISTLENLQSHVNIDKLMLRLLFHSLKGRLEWPPLAFL